MATILPFEAKTGNREGDGGRRGPATIVIFPGVRYERPAGADAVSPPAPAPKAGPAKL